MMNKCNYKMEEAAYYYLIYDYRLFEGLKKNLETVSDESI